MKKLTALVLALLTLFTYTAFADEVLIEKIVYEGKGMVDVDFVRNVRYDNLQITVQDAEGNAYEAALRERDEDDLDFRVNNLIPGAEYSFTISGVSSGNSGSFGSVSGSFAVPENEALAIKKVEYDRGDRELDVEFFSRVNLQGIEVKITDAAGTEYEVKIRELDKDGFEAYVPGLEQGESYTIEVFGLDAAETGGIPFSFVARDD